MRIEKTEVIGWEHAMRGMRNPYVSWDKSDSAFGDYGFVIGENDMSLMINLAKAGTDHGKFMRFIVAYVDIEAPLYWWKQFMTYRMGVEVDSCSTMHTLGNRHVVMRDFENDGMTDEAKRMLKRATVDLNYLFDMYRDTGDKSYIESAYKILPDSFKQKRTCMISYAALRNMYHARKNHKLKEWHIFCKWVEGLPYSELITEA